MSSTRPLSCLHLYPHFLPLLREEAVYLWPKVCPSACPLEARPCHLCGNFLLSCSLAPPFCFSSLQATSPQLHHVQTLRLSTSLPQGRTLRLSCWTRCSLPCHAPHAPSPSSSFYLHHLAHTTPARVSGSLHIMKSDGTTLFLLLFKVSSTSE